MQSRVVRRGRGSAKAQQSALKVVAVLGLDGVVPSWMILFSLL